MFKVALTGGIASGKTTVCEFFNNLGVPIIDADLVAKSLLDKDEIGYTTAIDLFGKQILQPDNAEINLGMFRELIFTNVELKQQYEKIIHPVVYQRINEFQEEYSKYYTIACIPLLFETKQEKQFDSIVLVVSDRSRRIDRSINRDKVKQEQIELIIDNQIDVEKAIQLSDHIIYNNNDLASLRNQVIELHNLLIK